MNLQPLTGGPDPPLANLVPLRPDTDTPPEASERLPPDSAPSTSTPQPAPSTRPERRSHSKIGRLCKTIRDKLNFMIRDGVPYGDILSKLGHDAKDITARNISSWQS